MIDHQDSSGIGARFEGATLELFKQLFPLLGFDVICCEARRSGTQKGFDIFFQVKPNGSNNVHINFFIECKGAKTINLLPLSEFEGKPELLDNSLYNPDYWILLSPLRYLGNDFQELLHKWKRYYPFAFVTWVRESKDADSAGLYLDLYKHFPSIYELFKKDIPANIRDLPPRYSLDYIIVHLKNTLNYAYSEFHDRAILRGIIPGVKRITPQSIYKSKETDSVKLDHIRNSYYLLNTSSKYVWRVVCNDLDVKNEKLTALIKNTVNDVREPIANIWILGAPGTGKTTQMYRSAIDFVNSGYPTILIDANDIDLSTKVTDYQRYFEIIYHLHNTFNRGDNIFPLLVFIDNPAAQIDHVTNILNYFDDHEENIKCYFILFERDARFHQAEEDDLFSVLYQSNSSTIRIDNNDTIFRDCVFRAFVDALNLTSLDTQIAHDCFLNRAEISIAESIIDFCKQTRNTKYKNLFLDWVDYAEITEELRLDDLTDVYKWVSILYQFGISMPASILKKVLPSFNENQFYNFLDFFHNDKYEQMPIVLEGGTLRTRHELLAQWYVEEKLQPSLQQRLTTLLKVSDLTDASEQAVFVSLISRKYIVKQFFISLSGVDIYELKERAKINRSCERTLKMMIGWIQTERGEFSAALDTFKEVIAEHPKFPAPIIEASRVERFLGRDQEAETLLKSLLLLEPRSLHARTELAKLYLIQQRYDEAETILKECLRYSPNHLHSRTELARVYRAQSKYTDAENILQELLTLDYKNIYARTELAKVYQLQERYDEAEGLLNDLIRLDPRNLHAVTETAKVFQALGRYDEAEILLEKSLKSAPHHAHSYTELAKVYQAQEAYDKAETILKKSLELDPLHMHARTELAKVYQAQNRFIEAAHLLEETLKLKATHAYTYTELARVYQAQNRYAEAESVLRKLLELEPKSTHGRTELARVYHRLEKYDDEENILQELLTLDYKDIYARTELAKVYQLQERYDEAEGLLNDLIRLDPRNLHGRTELAKLRQLQERYDEAELLLKQCLTLSPDDLNSRTELARIYRAQSRHTEAINVLKESLTIYPKSGHARTELAKIFHAQERYDEEESILTELLIIETTNIYARTELAKLHQLQERYDEAELLLKQCLTLSPDDLNSRTELARIYRAQSRHTEAEQLLKECLILSPTDVISRSVLAKIYHDQGKYNDELTILEELVILEPTNLYTRTSLSKAYRFQQMYGEVEMLLKGSLLLYQNHLPSQIELAKIYAIQNRYAEAEEILRTSLEREPNQLHARSELAKVYRVQGKYGESESILYELLRLDPNNLYAPIGLAKIYQIQGKFKEAIDILKSCIATSPSQIESRRELANIYRAQAQLNEAAKVLKEILEINPNQQQINKELIMLYIKLGLYRRAKYEVMNLFQNSASAHQLKSHFILSYLIACFRLKRYQEGIDFLDELGCHFISPQVAEEYGRLLKNCDLSSAILFFRTASRIFSSSGRLLSEAAVCLKLAGSPDSEQYLELAIKVDQHNEAKYRSFFNNARRYNAVAIKNKDCTGQIDHIDYVRRSGTVKDTTKDTIKIYSFNWTFQSDNLFRSMGVSELIFFDLTFQNQVINIEPLFNI